MLDTLTTHSFHAGSVGGFFHIAQVLCQSIIGALACARSAAFAKSCLLSRCQSIIGALACARHNTWSSYARSCVSVDHRRAGLRAGNRAGGSDDLVDVSVDHRRAGLRAGEEIKADTYYQLCQSIIGALACARFVEVE